MLVLVAMWKFSRLACRPKEANHEHAGREKDRGGCICPLFQPARGIDAFVLKQPVPQAIDGNRVRWLPCLHIFRMGQQ
jgi:hypothetical protein